jgi:hypothetical protein
VTLEWRTLRPGEIDHELLWSAVGLAAAVLAVAGGPVVGFLPVGCAFRAITGMPCPTCGATRAVLALLQGEWYAALRFNPLLTVTLIGWLAWLPYGLATGARRGRRLRVALSSRDCTSLRVFALGAIAVNWAFLVLDGR